MITYQIGNSTKAKELVLDTFLGSGTTLLACENLERVCYGMELDPAYCDVIVTRWCKHTGNDIVVLNGEKIQWDVTP